MKNPNRGVEQKSKTAKGERPYEDFNMDMFEWDVASADGGNKYAVMIVDNFNNFQFIHAQPAKKDIGLNAVKNWLVWLKKRVPTTKGRRPVRIVFDKGGENIKKEVQQLLLDEGMEVVPTDPNCQWQNAAVEIAHGYTMNSALAMLAQEKAPDQFLWQAIKAAVNLHNVTPSRAKGSKDAPWVSPFMMYEIAKGKSRNDSRADVCRTPRFMAHAYGFVPKEQRNVTGDKGRKLVVLYEEDSREFAFRVWDSESQGFSTVRNPTFLSGKSGYIGPNAKSRRNLSYAFGGMYYSHDNGRMEAVPEQDAAAAAAADQSSSMSSSDSSSMDSSSDLGRPGMPDMSLSPIVSHEGGRVEQDDGAFVTDDDEEGEFYDSTDTLSMDVTEDDVVEAVEAEVHLRRGRSAGPAPEVPGVRWWTKYPVAQNSVLEPVRITDMSLSARIERLEKLVGGPGVKEERARALQSTVSSKQSFLAQQVLKYEAREESPSNWRKMLECARAEEYQAAAKEHMAKIESFGAFEVVKQLPPGAKPIASWIMFSTKIDESNAEYGTKATARLIVAGHTMQKEKDAQVGSNFAPVADLTSVIMLYQIAFMLNMVTKSFDIVSAFLNVPCKQEVYITPPEGFKPEGGGFWRAVKAVFGLPNSPQTFWLDVCAYILSLGYTQCAQDQCTFVSNPEGKIMYDRETGALCPPCAPEQKFPTKGLQFISLTVDNFTVHSQYEEDHTRLEDLIEKKYPITREGKTDGRYHLGFCTVIDKSANVLIMHVAKHIEKVVSLLGLQDAKTCTFPTYPAKPEMYEGSPVDPGSARVLCGHLRWISYFRPDCRPAIQWLTRRTARPSPLFWTTMTRLGRYMVGTKYFGLATWRPTKDFVDKQMLNGKRAPIQLYGCADASFLGEDNAMSVSGATLGFVNGRGPHEAALFWQTSVLQDKVSQTSHESEARALAQLLANESRKRIKQLEELGFPQEPVTLFEDSVPLTMAVNHEN
ncbi:MAG: reverse transcriptase domain-containing protein, partial [Rectinemataceae bacterium]|nr:reverse transcriptase domain-containing protein [Rectinemataceae bacterium]